MPDVTLRPLDDEDEPAARAAHEELAADDFPFLLDVRAGEAWADYVRRMSGWPHGRGLPDGWVPSVFLGADLDGQLAGRLSFRYQLTDWLAEVGGHIGYAVRPAFRGRGVATSILTGALSLARERGFRRVLVTCDDDNHASARVIEKCGGVFERVTRGDEDRPKRRYWVDV